MRLVYEWLFPVAWALFVAYWILSAAWAKRIKVTEPIGARLTYRPFAMVAILILVFPRRFPALRDSLWPENLFTFFSGAAVMLAGLAFAVWARVHLGRNWSATVAIKEDHHLIRSGPYGLVRHPIYTGILAALLGTAIAAGTINVVAAFFLFSISFWLKSRFEETFMVQTFGDQYIQYRKEVPALVPFLKF